MDWWAMFNIASCANFAALNPEKFGKNFLEIVGKRVQRPIGGV
jgi:hypothetical protein